MAEASNSHLVVRTLLSNSLHFSFAIFLFTHSGRYFSMIKGSKVCSCVHIDQFWIPVQCSNSVRFWGFVDSFRASGSNFRGQVLNRCWIVCNAPFCWCCLICGVVAEISQTGDTGDDGSCAIWTKKPLFCRKCLQVIEKSQQRLLKECWCVLWNMQFLGLMCDSFYCSLVWEGEERSLDHRQLNAVNLFQLYPFLHQRYHSYNSLGWVWVSVAALLRFPEDFGCTCGNVSNAPISGCVRKLRSFTLPTSHLGPVQFTSKIKPFLSGSLFSLSERPADSCNAPCTEDWTSFYRIARATNRSWRATRNWNRCRCEWRTRQRGCCPASWITWYVQLGVIFAFRTGTLWAFLVRAHIRTRIGGGHQNRAQNIFLCACTRTTHIRSADHSCFDRAGLVSTAVRTGSRVFPAGRGHAAALR